MTNGEGVDENGMHLTHLIRIAREALRAIVGIVNTPENEQGIEALKHRASHPIAEIAGHWRESRALSIDHPN